LDQEALPLQCGIEEVFMSDNQVGGNLGQALEQLYSKIQSRIAELPADSYVAKLHQDGLDRILKKIGEEAGEVIIAAKNNSKAELTLEASDLLFHLLFVMAEVGVKPEDVAAELERRHR
jgi:phosphoribosyl-AMP cyclohydrolase / phosphoribosyl-ATP pyrophosphohydrolase